ncbi:hypothetical protein MASR2M74_26380 [Paracoccaceae bacterium]
MSREVITALDWVPGPRPDSSKEIPSELFPARQRFRDLIIERIMALEALGIRVKNGQEPRAALTGIVALSHKIAGVAGSLGFTGAGNLAAALEKNYLDLTERKTPLRDIWRDTEPRLLALMDELEALLDE